MKSWVLPKEGWALKKVARAAGVVSILFLLFATPGWGQTLAASVLPASRSVQVGTTATAFATIVNAGPGTAIACRIAPPPGLPITFVFQTTNPTTNQVTGTPNTPVNIPAGAVQTFVFALTPSAPIPPTNLVLNFSCTNTPPAPTIVGVNTLLFAASAVPVPDIVALAATPSRDGIMNLGGPAEPGVFVVAAVNMGAGGAITVSADTGGVPLPLSLAICQTVPATGVCMSPPAGNVPLQINANATPTFGVFVTAGATIPFDPATNRIFVRFQDAGGTRGLTSVAVVAGPFLTAADVRTIIKTAAESIDATTMVVAVTDREGNVLGVFRKPNAPDTVIGTFGVPVDANELAIGLARTGAFFFNDQAPLSSRTVRFISGIHFPPGVTNTLNAALYGIENTNRGCDLNAAARFLPGQAINPARSINGLPCTSTDRRGCGVGISTGKADLFDSNPNAVNGGGVPIFKLGRLVGGVGVSGVAPDSAEFAAAVASTPDTRFAPPLPPPGAIFLDGIELPFVNQTTRPGGVGPGTGTFTDAGFVAGQTPRDSPRGVVFSR